MISSYVHSNKTPFITFTSYLHYFILCSLSLLCIRWLLLFTFGVNLQRKTLRTMVKKGKVVISEKSKITPLLMDITCNREGGISTWEAMYNILEEEKPRILETKITFDGCDSSNPSLLETGCSFLHRIAIHLKIIPYTDMVKWVIDQANILDIEFKTRSQEVMGSFTPENLRLMYHLPEPQVI